MCSFGAHADVRPRLARELADQEDEPADPLRELALVGLAVLRDDDALVDLAQQHTGVDHLRRERLEQLVARNGRTQGAAERSRDASWMMRSCERSWLCVPAASTAGSSAPRTAGAPAAAGSRRR
jgi:hypothetical protein